MRKEYHIALPMYSLRCKQIVKYKVEAFTGMEIEKINIMVEGVRAID